MRSEKTPFLLFGLITFGVYLIFVDFAHLRFITPDASTYLNISENIISQKGFFVVLLTCLSFFQCITIGNLVSDAWGIPGRISLISEIYMKIIAGSIKIYLKKF